MAKHAMRSILVMSATLLLFACGGSEKTQLNSATQAQLAVSLSMSRPLQCSAVATIAAGAYHTVGLKEDGTVVAVGHNGYGQTNVSPWTNIKAIAAGTYHTVGLKEDGTVVAVGSNGSGQLNVSLWTNIK